MEGGMGTEEIITGRRIPYGARGILDLIQAARERADASLIEADLHLHQAAESAQTAHDSNWGVNHYTVQNASQAAGKAAHAAASAVKDARLELAAMQRQIEQKLEAVLQRVEHGMRDRTRRIQELEAQLAEQQQINQAVHALLVTSQHERATLEAHLTAVQRQLDETVRELAQREHTPPLRINPPYRRQNDG
jgi:uncharacterized coiled-coil protein SlyX